MRLDIGGLPRDIQRPFEQLESLLRTGAGVGPVGPQGPPGADGADGATGPPGPPGSGADSFISHDKWSVDG